MISNSLLLQDLYLTYPHLTDIFRLTFGAEVKSDSGGTDLGIHYFSPKDAAIRLSLSRKTVYSLMRTGKLAYCKLGSGRGSRVRISEEDIAKFMEDRRRKPFATEA